MLSVVSIDPDPGLAPYVRRYVQRSFDLGSAEIVEPVMARLGAMLEFQFADPYAIPAYADGRPNPCPAVTIIGPITYRRVRLLIRGRVEALAVIFQPLGFQAVFGVPTAPLAEIGTDAHAVLGPDVSKLHQRLGDLRRLEDRAAVLDAYLRSFLQSKERDPVRFGLRKLTLPDNRSSVAEIAERVGVSLRHLERKSLEYAGVRPKLLERVARFQRALSMSTSGARSWTEIAHAVDYYDQPHMVRDFRVMAGAAPNAARASLDASHLIGF